MFSRGAKRRNAPQTTFELIMHNRIHVYANRTLYLYIGKII